MASRGIADLLRTEYSELRRYSGAPRSPTRRKPRSTPVGLGWTGVSEKDRGGAWCCEVVRGVPCLAYYCCLFHACQSSCTWCFLSSVRAQYGVVDGVFIHRSIVLHPATYDGSRVSPLGCKLCGSYSVGGIYSVRRYGVTEENSMERASTE